MNGLELINVKNSQGYFWVLPYRHGDTTSIIASRYYLTKEDAIKALFENNIKWKLQKKGWME